MSEKELNVRFQLRYDTFQAWIDADPVLKLGEVAVCAVPTNSAASITNPPAILFKVGDGVNKFSVPPWTSGLAADVFEWAKQPNKPTYSYEEITNLPDIPAGTVLKVTTPENSGLQITDEAVNPSIEFDSNAVFILDGGSAPAVEEGNS